MNKVAMIALMTLLWSCSKKETVEVAEPAKPEAEAPRRLNVDLLVGAPTEVLANEQVTFVPIEKHHFELKAPQECAGFELSEKSTRKLTCQVTAPGEHKISLNVCDDDKTACKPVRYTLLATAPKGYVAEGAPARVLQPPKHDHPPVAGFLINKTDEAVTAAKTDDKLLFIHFFGIWCPPCNLLEEYVYTKKPFLEATQGMVRVMIDADSDLSWAWKARFKVGGYPTVVIATAELEEISRVVGYRPVAQMVEFATAAESNRATPIAKLIAAHDIKTAADAPDDARKRVGMYHFERKEWAQAHTWLAEHSDPEARKSWIGAEQQIAKRDGDDAKGLELTKRLVMDFPDDIQFSSWVKQLVDAKDADGEGSAADAFANLEAWKSSKELAQTGYSLADVAWLEADLKAALGDEEAAKSGYRRSAELYGEMAKSSSLEVARGANMERAYALHKAGENEQAKALYEELSAAYAEEFSFNYNYAYVLNELKEHDAALVAVDKAVTHAYGDNLLRAQYLRAKVQRAQGNTDAARTTIDAALAEAIVPRSTDVRTHRYITNLRTLRGELLAPSKTTKE